MNPGIDILVKQNLKDLKLTAMLKQLEPHLRDARENQQSYEEFLLTLMVSDVNYFGRFASIILTGFG